MINIVFSRKVNYWSKNDSDSIIKWFIHCLLTEYHVIFWDSLSTIYSVDCNVLVAFFKHCTNPNANIGCHNMNQSKSCNTLKLVNVELKIFIYINARMDLDYRLLIYVYIWHFFTFHLPEHSWIQNTFGWK